MSKVACKATKYEQQEVGANCKGVPGNNCSLQIELEENERILPINCLFLFKSFLYSDIRYSGTCSQLNSAKTCL